ncbi:hypothetical protein BDY24DRAFT_232697 [Mrakia frigida]|uniref:uncharacterized protein n=1 Tax=Mrakia frigida TaxID=29902 RepID=UPI003FCC0ECD
MNTGQSIAVGWGALLIGSPLPPFLLFFFPLRSLTLFLGDFRRCRWSLPLRSSRDRRATSYSSKVGEAGQPNSDLGRTTCSGRRARSDQASNQNRRRRETVELSLAFSNGHDGRDQGDQGYRGGGVS